MYLGNFKGFLRWFLSCEGKSECGELRAGSLQCENNTGLWRRPQETPIAWKRLVVVVLNVWKECGRCKAVFPGGFDLQKKAEFEQLQSRGSTQGCLHQVRRETIIKIVVMIQHSGAKRVCLSSLVVDQQRKMGHQFWQTQRQCDILELGVR